MTKSYDRGRGYKLVPAFSPNHSEDIHIMYIYMKEAITSFQDYTTVLYLPSKNKILLGTSLLGTQYSELTRTYLVPVHSSTESVSSGCCQLLGSSSWLSLLLYIRTAVVLYDMCSRFTFHSPYAIDGGGCKHFRLTAATLKNTDMLHFSSLWGCLWVITVEAHAAHCGTAHMI